MSDHAASALHLGFLTQPRPRGGQPRGEGFELRSDVKRFCYPERFMDERGVRMWETVMAVLRRSQRACEAVA